MTPPEETRSEQQPNRRWLWFVGAVVLIVVIGTAAYVLAGSDAAAQEDGQAMSTAEVVRTDLEVTETLSGTLGYGEATAVAFRTSPDGVETVYGGLAGVVTDAPPEGELIEEGDVLYRVNAAAVVVLYGDTPVYRTLDRRTSDGADVLSLEQSLVDLGYDPDGDIEIDEDFTSATSAAIELLQEDIGADVDGAFALGEMLFAVGPTYVAEALVTEGDQVQFGSPVAALSEAPGGTYTEVAPEGAIIDQGDALYRVDNRPTVLLYGDLPVYRAMTHGDEGTDIGQLQAALNALGYSDDNLSPGSFDDATLEAVVTWQHAIGAHPDGVVNVGEVVFLPSSIRVGEQVASTGEVAASGAPVVRTSASSTFVTVELSTADRSLVEVGDTVEVELPDGSVVSARVTSIGTVAQANQAGENFFELIVTIDDSDATTGLDEAPVDVDIISDSATDVLAVPVTALLALAEGGYAVEVVDGNSTGLVGVETGLFADGLVEVSGNGLSEGVLVVVP